MIFHPLHLECSIPTSLNDPFNGIPTPIANLATEDLKGLIFSNVASNSDWNGETTKGKMFGVLVVKDENLSIGYLGAYSGQIGGRADWDDFVPAVYDYLQPDGHFKMTERQRTGINHYVDKLSRSSICLLDLEKKESLEAELMELKHRRHAMSKDLQKWLFSKFVMLNNRGEKRDLNEIFKVQLNKLPPSGSGECCAPKLLQYAFMHNLIPLSIAEFWLGTLPNAENRENNHFYGACENKCRPILNFMLG